MSSELSDLIHSRVDRILCLTCPQSVDTRYPEIVKEFTEHGVGDLLVPVINVHSVLEHAELNRRSFVNEGAKATNVKNCMLGHYHMAKLAKDAGYGRVMLIEDDCRFARDTDFVVRYLRELQPDTNSVLSYCGFPRDLFARVFSSSTWTRWGLVPKGTFFDLATCYILNKAGVDELVSLYEGWGTDGYGERVDAADRVWPHMSRSVDLYIPRISLFNPSGGVSIIHGREV